MIKKTGKITETLEHGRLYESYQQELSNKYQYDRVKMVFRKSLHPCALDKSSFSITLEGLRIPVILRSYKSTKLRISDP